MQKHRNSLASPYSPSHQARSAADGNPNTQCAMARHSPACLSVCSTRPLRLHHSLSGGADPVKIAFLHLPLVILLTLLSQLGGVAWLIALRCKRRLPAFLASYLLLSASAIWIAPVFGREPIPCGTSGTLQMQSWLFCALNRNYVVPDLHDAAVALADRMAQDFPGTITLALDANFPFLNGFPLLPHLSHNDDQKLDLAFYYRNKTGYLPGATRSPIGYFTFENGPTDCPDQWPTLRWNLRALQGLRADLSPDAARMTAALTHLADDARVGRVFLEPHLQKRFAVQSPKLRFQGCNAARHDDHIHIQL
jgi:hypothetical protein